MLDLKAVFLPIAMSSALSTTLNLPMPGGVEPTPVMFFLDNFRYDEAIETKFRLILQYLMTT